MKDSMRRYRSHLQVVVLIHLWCYCLGGFASTMSEQVHPIKVGQMFTFDCSVITPTPNRHVYWKVQRPGENLTILAKCYDQDDCHNHHLNKYLATIDRYGTSFTSTLKIRNVTNKDRNAVFMCLIDNFSDPERVAHSWNLSQIYSPPHYSRCQAQVQDEENITVFCVTTEVFADVTCQIYNTSGSSLSDVSPALANSSYCSLHVKPCCFGKYHFVVEVFPSIKFQSGSEREEVTVRNTTNSVLFAFKPSVKLQNPMETVHHLCDLNNTVIEFKCTALWFQSIARITWYLDESVVYANASTREGRGHHYIISSTYKLRLNTSLHNKTVICQVSMQNEIYRNSTVLRLQWPPTESPYFRMKKNKTVIRHVYNARENEENELIECFVAGGEPLVYAVNVSCTIANSVHHISNETNSVEISHYHNLHGAVCLCSALHQTSCYNLSSTLSIPTATPVPAWGGMDEDKVIILIAISTLLLLYLLMLIVGCILKSCVVCKKFAKYSLACVAAETFNTLDYEPIENVAEVPALPKRNLRSRRNIVSYEFGNVTVVPALPEETYKNYSHLPKIAGCKVIGSGVDSSDLNPPMFPVGRTHTRSKHTRLSYNHVIARYDDSKRKHPTLNKSLLTLCQSSQFSGSGVECTPVHVRTRPRPGRWKYSDEHCKQAVATSNSDSEILPPEDVSRVIGQACASEHVKVMTRLHSHKHTPRTGTTHKDIPLSDHPLDPAHEYIIPISEHVKVMTWLDSHKQASRTGTTHKDIPLSDQLDPAHEYIIPLSDVSSHCTINVSSKGTLQSEDTPLSAETVNDYKQNMYHKAGMYTL